MSELFKQLERLATAFPTERVEIVLQSYPPHHSVSFNWQAFTSGGDGVPGEIGTCRAKDGEYRGPCVAVDECIKKGERRDHRALRLRKIAELREQIARLEAA